MENVIILCSERKVAYIASLGSKNRSGQGDFLISRNLGQWRNNMLIGLH